MEKQLIRKLWYEPKDLQDEGFVDENTLREWEKNGTGPKYESTVDGRKFYFCLTILEWLKKN